MATQRTQRAFLAHRKARQAGLILPERPQADPANENRTNENTPEPDRPRVPPTPAEPNPPNGTNELPRPSQARPVSDPLTPLRARLDRLLDGSDPRSPEEWDLVEAIRAAKLPGAAPYGGVIERGYLDRLPTEYRFDGTGLTWLAALGPARRVRAGAPGGPMLNRRATSGCAGPG
ncbi:MAG: hypothetical protein ACJ8H8_17595 [Geminicoccaceae bacterium]